MSFSVLIIVRNREEHLLSVLEAIVLSTMQPSEIIIIRMNEALKPISTDLPIKQIKLQSDHTLPLAAARNLAARHATTDQLIFLDVDCIPAPDCFEQLLNELTESDLIMADPRYLTSPVEYIDFAVLEKEGRINPARKGLRLGDSTTFELFWSLGFAISRHDFDKIGGFDEAYTGYGGEDTDFAFSARSAGLRLRYSRARVHHQDHPSYDPPLNWLEDIVSNARQFRRKWGTWPMQGWLGAFEHMGYITMDQDTITIRKLPTKVEIDNVLKPTAL